MRTFALLVLGAGAVVAGLLLMPRDEPHAAAPEAKAPVTEPAAAPITDSANTPATASGLRSYVVRALLPGADDPDQERFLIISPHAATLGKGVPPT